MLADLAHQRLAVAFRHPLLRFDLLASVNSFLKGAFDRVQLVERLDTGAVGFDHLCVHGSSPLPSRVRRARE